MPPDCYDPPTTIPMVSTALPEARYKSGATNAVAALVDPDVAIATGDLVWLSANHARPASLFGRGLTEPVTWLELQRRFARVFLGVALSASPVGTSGSIRVATDGVFLFNCRAGIAQLGGLVAPGLTPDGELLENQRVALVNRPERAIGRVAQFELRPTTRIHVWIFSRVMRELGVER